MALTYILIDFENVQPTAAELGLIRGPDLHVRLFHGPHQNKFDADVVKALQPLGAQVDYVQCDRKGKNALDFRIAFILGRLVQEREGAVPAQGRLASFVVVSKDGGFDELLDHLRSLGHGAFRVASVAHALGVEKQASPATPPTTKAKVPASVPSPTAAKPKKAAANDPWSRAIANLRDHPRNRPRTPAALQHHLKTLLGKDATDAKVQSIIARLEREGLVKAIEGKIEYRLPAKAAKAAA
jgi:hypothetical protein